MTASSEFRAFISYCHADARFAARLQRRLEGYRLPRRLAEAVPPLEGQAAGRVGPVFRDRADLSAAHDLSRAVREALERSRALIVVASPDGAQSQWVAREIALFRELHPDAPVFVALARGEPGEALPPALSETGAEPLAADFRREGDGRLAFLKIVAGIAGVPLDALAQRDAQRRLRSVTVVTLAALGLVAVMAALLVMAVQARREAERQRSGAEGLVEYMLTDLRRELKGVGPLHFMRGVNARAMQYYAAQGDLSQLPDDSLERRARVLHAMGEDDENSGDLTEALARFVEAHRTTAAILARRPDDADAIFAHAQSEFWIGFAAWQQQDYAKVAGPWGRYREGAETLARVEPGSRRSTLERVYAHGNLCELAVQWEREVPAGLEHCRQSIALAREQIARAPGDDEARMILANRLGWLAESLVDLNGDLAEASRLRGEEAAIVDRLLRQSPDDAMLRQRATWPRIGLGRIDVAQGRTQAGVSRWRAALRELDALADKLPENRDLLTLRVRVHVLIARALRSAGDARWKDDRDRATALVKTASDTMKSPALERYQTALDAFDEGK